MPSTKLFGIEQVGLHKPSQDVMERLRRNELRGSKANHSAVYYLLDLGAQGKKSKHMNLLGGYINTTLARIEDSSAPEHGGESTAARHLYVSEQALKKYPWFHNKHNDDDRLKKRLMLILVDVVVRNRVKERAQDVGQGRELRANRTPRIDSGGFIHNLTGPEFGDDDDTMSVDNPQPRAEKTPTNRPTKAGPSTKPQQAVDIARFNKDTTNHMNKPSPRTEDQQRSDLMTPRAPQAPMRPSFGATDARLAPQVNIPQRGLSADTSSLSDLSPGMLPGGRSPKSPLPPATSSTPTAHNQPEAQASTSTTANSRPTAGPSAGPSARPTARRSAPAPRPMNQSPSRPNPAPQTNNPTISTTDHRQQDKLLPTFQRTEQQTSSLPPHRQPGPRTWHDNEPSRSIIPPDKHCLFILSSDDPSLCSRHKHCRYSNGPAKRANIDLRTLVQTQDHMPMVPLRALQDAYRREVKVWRDETFVFLDRYLPSERVDSDGKLLNFILANAGLDSVAYEVIAHWAPEGETMGVQDVHSGCGAGRASVSAALRTQASFLGNSPS